MQVEIQVPNTMVNEGSYVNATAYFRQSDAATTPTSAEYKVFNLSTWETTTDWTALSPAGSVSINVLADVRCESSRQERYELIVRADSGLSTQAVGRREYRVRNLRGLE